LTAFVSVHIFICLEVERIHFIPDWEKESEKNQKMDEEKFKRIYSTSLMVATFSAAICLTFLAFDWALGVMIGNCLSVAMLYLISFTVRRFVQHESKWKLLFLWVIKFIAIGAIIYLIVKYPVFNTYSFLIGFILLHLVIVLKFIGRTLFVTT